MTTNNFSPILFSTEMVQAILAGRKMQTRRVVKSELLSGPAAHPLVLHEKNLKEYINVGIRKNVFDFLPINIGEILWVRETFAKPPITAFGVPYIYKAGFDRTICGWKPSIHMPKEAARIFLKVTNVRVERLQDISEEDVKAEGIERDKNGFMPTPDKFWAVDGSALFNSAKLAFIHLWQKINAKKHPWESNPWVWVYEFERIEKPENFLS